jgi:hypothetical protein
MSLIRADIPTIVIGMKDIGFANAGINSYNTYKIIKIADPFESFNPLDPINAITGFEKDAAYFFFAKETIDLTGIADNAVPVNLDTTSGNNVFANMAFAGVAKTTASFATVGFNTSNLLWIYKVSDPYESYNPNDPYNPIDGFEVNECYYGYALADMDLNAYLIPPIVIKDDVEKATDTYKYWGTEATTDKDFYNVPVRFFADEASLPATGIQNIVYVAKAEKTSWYWDGSAYQQIGGGIGTSYTFSDSLNKVAGTVNLDGDSATPGNSKYYGTDGAGAKGFYALPATGITSETDPTVPTLVKNIPVSADAATNKYLNWNGSAYTRKQVDYSEIAGTAPSGNNIYNTDGSLTGNRTVTNNGFELKFTRTGAGKTIYALTTSGEAVYAEATTGFGVRASSTGSNPAIRASKHSTDAGSILPVIDIQRSTTGTPVAGIGIAYDFYVQSASGVPNACRIGIKYTTVTAGAEASVFEISLQRAGSLTKEFAFAKAAITIVAQYTPTSSTDTTHAVGTMCFDDNFLYYRTSTGTWKKIALTAF